tara:strand:- start:768 stop:2093 length:1326 start_codon:yes stop_codon:yes gene_type:complete
MAKKEDNIDTSIIDNQMKKEAITGESDSKFGAFNNKYVKGAFLSVLAAYAAKNEPYFLKGFQERVDELDKADRETRNKFIDSATSAASTEIARNKLRRLERRETIAPEIKRAVANGISPVIAGKAYKTGNLATFMKLKSLKPELDINALYTVSEEFKNNTGSFQPNDVIEAITGPTLKLQNAFNNLKTPRSISPIRNFLSDGTDTSATDEIQKNIDAQTTSSNDYKAIDFSGVNLSDKGKRLLESASGKQPITYNSAKSDLAKWTGSIMKLGKNAVDLSAGDFVFKSDDANNNQYATKVTDKLIREAEVLIKDTDSLAFNNRAIALDIVKKKYSKRNDDGTFNINITKINAGEEEKLVPEGWTPAKSTEVEIDKSKKSLIASNEIGKYKDIIKSIKNNRTMTTTKRNSALNVQKTIYRNKIIAMMKRTPPTATQDDLDQIK